MSEPPTPRSSDPGTPAEKRIVIKGVSKNENASASVQKAKAAAAAAPRSSRTLNAVVVAGVGGAIVALSPFLSWWNADPKAQTPAPGEVATFAKIKGVQAWPGFLCVLLGAAIVIMAVVASKPDAALRLVPLGRAIIGVGAFAVVVGLFAVGSGTSIIGQSALDISAALPAHLAWIGGIVGIVGGGLLLRSAPR